MDSQTASMSEPSCLSYAAPIKHAEDRASLCMAPEEVTCAEEPTVAGRVDGTGADGGRSNRRWVIKRGFETEKAYRHRQTQ
jgi:hypothetical protein